MIFLLLAIKKSKVIMKKSQTQPEVGFRLMKRQIASRQTMRKGDGRIISGSTIVNTIA
jgi:hypothetical protein